MNSKIILSGLSIVTAMALMAGGSFAYFSSTATSTANAFSTGTLALQLDDNNETTPAASVTASFGGTMAPGDSKSGFVSLHNSGTIDIAKVKLSASETTTSSPDLAGKLNITSVKIGTDQTCSTSPVDVTNSFTTLAALNGTPVTLPSSGITAGGTKYLCMTFTLDSGTGNTYQGTSIAETFSFEGDQNISQ